MQAPRSNLFARLYREPLLWGALLTCAYYYLINRGELRHSTLHQYTTGHATEYIMVALFLWAVADLAQKCLSFPREKMALGHSWLPPRSGQEPATNAAVLSAHLQEAPAWLQATRIAARFRQALAYVHERRSADGLGEYLRELSERDSDTTHSNYALARFIGWITPILGFLGTVVHFGTALGSLSPNELVEKLPIVAAGLGTGFNTTTVALAVAMLTMFLVFLIERTEQGIVKGIDHRIELELLNRFASTDARLTPFLDAVESNGKSTLAALSDTIARQGQIWSRSLTALERQNEEYQQRQIELWTTATLSHQERCEANENHREQQLREILATFDDRQTLHREGLQASVDRVGELQVRLERMAETLAGIFAGEGRLASLQERLVENLELIQQTQHLDQAVHGLTAAIHLLTVRQQPAGNQSAKAA